MLMSALVNQRDLNGPSAVQSNKTILCDIYDVPEKNQVKLSDATDLL